jgi:hypothetical protein
MQIYHEKNIDQCRIKLAGKIDRYPRKHQKYLKT